MGYTEIDKKLEDLINEISWDNWKVEEDYKGKSKDGEYWDITEVLYCKLEWLKELVKEEIENNEEEIDTVNQVQKLLELIDESKIRKI